MEDLVAIWKIASGQRFQNCRASLTILYVACVSHAWLNDVKAGSPLSLDCPVSWKNWVQNGSYQPLRAETSAEHRNKGEQIPNDERSMKIIQAIHEYFKDVPVAFEAYAATIAQSMDKNFFSFDLTRLSRAGGRSIPDWTWGVGDLCGFRA